MKSRGPILLLGSILLVAVTFAQNSGQDDLPSAPSAVQEQLQQAEAGSAASGAETRASPASTL